MQMFLFYDGRVFPCCHPFAHQKMQVGDLRTQTFAEFWNGRHLRNLRAGLACGDVTTICRNCSIVHDPPPVREDHTEVAASQDLAAHYADRDLDPVRGRTTDLFRQLAELGLLDYVAHLEAVVARDEREQARARESAAGAVVDETSPWKRALRRFTAGG